MMLRRIRIPINHRIHNQFFLNKILNNDTNTWITKTPNDINNPTGYTPSNLVNALLSLNARIAKILFVGFHITESHKVIKIQNIIRALANDKKSISAHIFLFSFLLILEKKIHRQIREDISNHTKWKLKFCGLNVANKLAVDDGKYVPVCRQNDI